MDTQTEERMEVLVNQDLVRAAALLLQQAVMDLVVDEGMDRADSLQFVTEYATSMLETAPECGRYRVTDTDLSDAWAEMSTAYNLMDNGLLTRGLAMDPEATDSGVEQVSAHLSGVRGAQLLVRRAVLATTVLALTEGEVLS